MSDKENGNNTERAADAAAAEAAAEAAPAEVALGLDQKLEALRQDLDAAKVQKVTAEANVAAAQAKVDALASLVADIAKTKLAYEADYPALRARQEAYREYLSNETKCLEKVLEGRTEEIGRTVATCKNEVAAAERAATAAKTKLEQLKTARAAADGARTAAKAKSEILKALPIAIKTRLNRLETIKNEVKKAHDDGEYAVAYWLLIQSTRFQETLDEKPGIVRPEELPVKLQAAWDDVRRAEDAYSKADDDVKAQEAVVAASDDALKDARQNVDAAIRAKLSAINPQQNKAA